MGHTVLAIIIVEKINNFLRETVITSVITRQYTVKMVVTNRKGPIPRCYDPTIIMAGTVVMGTNGLESRNEYDWHWPNRHVTV